MANTNGSTVNNGMTLEVTSGNSASNTTVNNGGTLQVDDGASETNALIQAGGTEILLGSATSSGDTVYGTVNVGNTAPGGTAASTAVVNNVTIENGGVVNLTIKNTSVNGATVLTGGALTINGNAAANNVTLQGGLFDLQSPKADSTNTSGVSASGTLTFASGVNSRLQIDVPQTGTNGTTFSQTIAGYAAGDVIQLKSLTAANPGVTMSTSNGNTTVTVGGTNTGAETFTFLNTPATAVFTTQTDGAGGTDLIEAACFAGGTLILTERGEVAIEALRVGDLVETVSGALRPIRWLGHRPLDCRRHPRPHEAMPVRVAAGAVAPGQPARDLRVSPGHALCIDDVLIPAVALVNGTTVIQEDVDAVTYWHVELEDHDVILADGMPSESYIDCGNRGFFVEAKTVGFAASPDAPAATLADYCRPFHNAGERVETVRARMGERVHALGWQAVPADADLHLLVDGSRVAPVRRGSAAVFALPAGARSVWLVSGTSRPLDFGGSLDPRRLGVCVAAITVADGFETRRVAASDERLATGFHPLEIEGGAAWRWTSGCACLPPALWQGCEGTIVLRVDLAHPALPSWVRPASDLAAVRAA